MKARLSTVVRDAEREGPQQITVHGRPVAVALARAPTATGSRPRASHWSRSFAARRCRGVEELDVERDRSLTRDSAP